MRTTDAATWTWYHGTTAERAALIQREGFQPDSWFAVKREVAEVMGGPVVLEVLLPYEPKIAEEAIDADPETGRWWQCHVLHAVPALAIVRRHDVDQ